MAKAAVLVETSVLNLFLLKPDCISGIKLFDHMVRSRLFDPNMIEHRPSSYLSIELSKYQMEKLGPVSKDLT